MPESVLEKTQGESVPHNRRTADFCYERFMRKNRAKANHFVDSLP